MMNAIAALSDRRIFFLGVNTGFVTDGKPDKRCFDFYTSRGSSNLHCAIVGNVVVPSGFGTNDVSPMITDEPVWADLAAAIRTAGSLPGIQLATTWAGYVGSRKFVGAQAHEFITWARELVRALGTEGIGSVLNSFDEAASVAARHGFAHVQLHAAHGYLLNLLADQRFNHDLARVLDRLTTLAERLKRVDIETSIRISLKTGEPNFDRDGIGAASFQDAISRLPFDYVDLSSGFYNIDKRLIYPARPDVLTARLEESLAVGSRHPDRAFIVSGRVMQYDWGSFAPNMHPGLCRDLIANPRFLQESHNGCENHGKCHYYSRGRDYLTCARWARSDTVHS